MSIFITIWMRIKYNFINNFNSSVWEDRCVVIKFVTELTSEKWNVCIFLSGLSCLYLCSNCSPLLYIYFEVVSSLHCCSVWVLVPLPTTNFFLFALYIDSSFWLDFGVLTLSAHLKNRSYLLACARRIWRLHFEHAWFWLWAVILFMFWFWSANMTGT